MKELRGTATSAVAASPEECLALLAAVDRYPTWHPEVVRGVEVLERDASGQPTRVRAKLHVSQGPLTKEFDLVMAVTVRPPSLVSLARIPHGPKDEEQFDVIWHVDASAQTQIRLDLHANLSVPRLLPIGGIGDALASGFVTAAAGRLASDRPR